MSYNTRRSGGYSKFWNTPPSQQSLGNIGQRRPMASNNFVPGGQLKNQVKAPVPNQQNPGQQQVRQQMQQPSNIQFRNQNQGQQQQQGQQIKPQAAQQVAQQQAQKVAQQQAAQQAAAQQQAAQQAAAQQQAAQQAAAQQQAAQQAAAQQQAAQQAAAQQQAAQQAAAQLQAAEQAAQQQAAQQTEQQLNKDSADITNGTPMETGEVKKKSFWAKGGGKISRREKVRRRNVRLSRMLQPKNAVMILNELVKNTSYMVEELPVKYDSNQFKATVLYEGIEHVGYGRSKIQAKNTAAEAALKHYVRTNKLTELKKDDEGNEKMDVTEDDASQSPLPWQHVASFALYKLFCSWGEDPNIVKNQSQSFGTAEKQHENKPAKKIPENPETINPLMLINQMLPQAQFEEIGKTGNPPNITFSFRCNVDGQSFIGTGPNKKAAKKLAAFGACNKILGINYPPDVYVPSY